MLLYDVAQASQAVAATRSRLAKRDLLAAVLARATADELEVVVAYLAGELRQRRTGIGWAALGSLPDPAAEPRLTVCEVDAEFEQMSRLGGPGSARRRAEAVALLFGRATPPEQHLLRGLVSGDVRQGALDAAMLDAVAAASGVPLVDIRRAAMLRGETGPVAVAALTGGAEAVAAFGLMVGQPVRPMLAASAPDVASALTKTGVPASLDVKLDGIRIQVHQTGDLVRVFTRSLDDITARLPEVGAAVRSLNRQAVILDGEVLTLDSAGRPRPFQDTASRTATHLDADTLPAGGGVATPFFFDVLHLDGVDLVDAPLSARLETLDELVPAQYRVARLTTASTSQAAEFFAEAVRAGQEGVVVKALDAPYDAGRRGSSWVKVKPRHTLDLVVLAVEWGSGRRQGWLSNIHLGAREPATGQFVMLGKTFKGMTDEMLAWQTARFLELEESRSGHVVRVRPEQVVEVAFDGLQRSTRYPGGLALRFARVVRYRDDKPAAEADTIDTVRELTATP
ncbi:MAG: ligase 1 [Nocardioidaceae bacterium]|jgi:DNA ligase-1|nr:ligase 1 [Nocardioidaceae bacterium]